MNIANTRNSLITALILAAAISACGGSGEKPKTQVLARVNGEEITVAQLNQVLVMMRPEAAVDPAVANRIALESIIDETIGVQAAVKMKLDRDPETLRAVETAKRRVLVDAYLQRALQNTPSPTASEVHEYLSRHPEMFAERRIYIFNQLTAKAGKKSVASLVSKVDGIDNLSEFAAWLKISGVEYDLISDVRPSEQLPAVMLEQMQRLKAGDLGYWSATDGVVVIEVVKIIDKPLTEQEARPLIERYLARQKQLMAEQGLFKEMRANAKVEYLGEFTPDAPLKQVVPPQADEPPSPAAPEKHKPPAPAANGTPVSGRQDTGGYFVTP